MKKLRKKRQRWPYYRVNLKRLVLSARSTRLKATTRPRGHGLTILRRQKQS